MRADNVDLTKMVVQVEELIAMAVSAQLTTMTYILRMAHLELLTLQHGGDDEIAKAAFEGRLGRRGH